MPAMPDVQGPSGIGGDELHQHLLAVGALAAKAGAGSQDFPDHLLARLGLEAKVDKARSGDLDGLHPLLVGRLRHQCRLQVLGELAGVGLERLGQLHGHVAGQIAVGRSLGGLENRLGTGPGQALVDFSGQSRQQLLFDGNHAWILSPRSEGEPQRWASSARARLRSRLVSGLARNRAGRSGA
jgi:hypothetical protein